MYLQRILAGNGSHDGGGAQWREKKRKAVTDAARAHYGGKTAQPSITSERSFAFQIKLPKVAYRSLQRIEFNPVFHCLTGRSQFAVGVHRTQRSSCGGLLSSAGQRQQ